jgi:hypothetical protein
MTIAQDYLTWTILDLLATEFQVTEEYSILVEAFNSHRRVACRGHAGVLAEEMRCLPSQQLPR